VKIPTFLFPFTGLKTNDLSLPSQITILSTRFKNFTAIILKTATMKTLTALLLLFGAVLTSCENKSTVDIESEKQKLMETSREWSRVAASDDQEKTLAYWSDDALVLSAGDPPLQGKEGIRQMVLSSFDDPNFRISWEPETAEISASGDMGYLIEDTQMTMKDSTGSNSTQHFKTVTIWKKQQDGSWKNVVDVMSPLPSR
jgi:ketosteroid isomerase-like protein